MQEWEGLPDVTVVAMLRETLLPGCRDPDEADEGEDKIGDHQTYQEPAQASDILHLGVAYDTLL